MNGRFLMMNGVFSGTENPVLTRVSPAADTARMRKVWTPPWPWVFGVATALSLFSWLQAWRLTIINSKPGIDVQAGKLLVLNLAYWYIPALLIPAVVWAARRYSFDTGRTIRAIFAHAVGALTFAAANFVGMMAMRFLLWTDAGKWSGATWAEYKGGDFPSVAVREIQVHPRDGDLVIATHGRGLYVVDDLTPLRMLTADVLARVRLTHLHLQRGVTFGKQRQHFDFQFILCPVQPPGSRAVNRDVHRAARSAAAGSRRRTAPRSATLIRVPRC